MACHERNLGLGVRYPAACCGVVHFVQSPTDLGQQFLREPRLNVHRRDRQMGLSAMVGELLNAREQQRARDRLESRLGMRQAHEFTSAGKR